MSFKPKKLDPIIRRLIGNEIAVMHLEHQVIRQNDAIQTQISFYAFLIIANIFFVGGTDTIDNIFGWIWLTLALLMQVLDWFT